MGLKKLAQQIKQEQKLREKTPGEFFIETLDSYLTKEGKQEREFRKAFNPSTYYKCQRYLFYRLRGVPEDKVINPRMQRIYRVGTALHNDVQDIVSSCVSLIPYEEMPFYGAKGVELISEHNSHPMEVKFLDYRWTEKIPVSAMVDGAIEFQNIQMLFEFKTINTSDFNILIEPLKDHVKQGALYVLCTGINRVMFLYMDKNTQEYKAYLVEYTEKQLDWVVNRLRYIEGLILANSLPAKEEGRDCRWCGYKKLCEEDKLITQESK